MKTRLSLPSLTSLTTADDFKIVLNRIALREYTTTREGRLQMLVYINGKEREVESGTSVEQLILLLGYKLSEVAVAVNGSIVRHKTWNQDLIADEDRIDVVTAMQGG